MTRPTDGSQLLQSVGWYIKRLRAMGAREVAWRLRSAGVDFIDRMRFAGGDRGDKLARMLLIGGDSSAGSGGESLIDGRGEPLDTDGRGESFDRMETAAGFAVSTIAPGEWADAAADSAEAAWRRRLVRRAEPLLEGKLTFFDQRERSLGEPIDWNRDVKSGKSGPLAFAPSVDYRDFDAVGDCKFVWEPNRHHHLVVLARAWRATGEARYAEAIDAQIRSWLEQCPFPRGMNWRSPLELGVRLINWVWTLDLLRGRPSLDRSMMGAWRRSAALHVWETARKFSQGSSANNHLVGEAAGVYIAAAYFSELRDRGEYLRRSREILCREILAQTTPDGVTREQAPGYQVFVGQFFLLAALVGEAIGEPFPAEYLRRLERMFDFLVELSDGEARPQMFGDADDGYVLDLDHDPLDVRPWIAVAARVFGRPEWAKEEAVEIGAWLPERRHEGTKARRHEGENAGRHEGTEAGRHGEERHEGTKARRHAEERHEGTKARRHEGEGHEGDRPLASRAFAEGGYYLLRHGRAGSDERIVVTFDCGPLGYGPLAAHGHADALSFTLRAFGVDVLVDAGTYDYFTYPAWRRYFRGTRAHNTIEIDGQDQSEMLGSFLWGARAQSRCVEWSPTERGGRVAGEHDGYMRLEQGILHRRTLELDGEARRLTAIDELMGEGEHDIAIYWHAAEWCAVRPLEEGAYAIDTRRGEIHLRPDPRFTTEVMEGRENPPGGWVSRGYHRREPAATIVGRCRARTPIRLETEMTLGGRPLRKERARRPEVVGSERSEE